MTNEFKNIPDVLYNILSKYNNVNMADIDNLFDKVSQVLAISTSDIITCSGYHDKQLEDFRNLNSYFSELRSILYLHNSGFDKIDFVTKLRKKPTPDMTAYFRTKKYAIEVYCRQKDSFFHPSGQILNDKIENYLTEEGKSKKNQLDYGFSELDCEYGMLIYVINAGTICALKTRNYYLELLKDIKNKLNWGDKIYFSLITGQADFMTNEICDVTYPSLV